MINLTDEKIEMINAYGPLNHSVWSDSKYIIMREDRLSLKYLSFFNRCIFNIFKSSIKYDL